MPTMTGPARYSQNRGRDIQNRYPINDCSDGVNRSSVSLTPVTRSVLRPSLLKTTIQLTSERNRTIRYSLCVVRVADHNCQRVEYDQSEKCNYFPRVPDTAEQQWKVKKWQDDSTPEAECSRWTEKTTVDCPFDTRLTAQRPKALTVRVFAGL